MKKIIVMILIFIMLSTTVQKDYAMASGLVEGVLATVVATNPEVAVLVGLGCLGVVCVASVYDNQDELCGMANKIKNDFIDFCSKSEKWVSLKATEIEFWLEGVSTGIIDKASDVFQAMKDYVVNLKERQDSFSDSSDIPSFDAIGTSLDLSIENVKSLYSQLKNSIVNQRCSATSVYSSRPAIQYPLYSIHADIYNSTEFYLNKDSTYYVIVRFNDRDVLYSISKNFDDTDIVNTCPYYFDASSSLNFTYEFTSLLNSAFKQGFAYSGDFTTRQSYYDNLANFGKVSGADLLIKFPSDWAGPTYGAIYGYLLTNFLFGDSVGIPLPGSKEDLANDVVIDNSIEQVIERDGTLDNVDVVNPSDVESDSVPVDLSGVTVQDIAEPFPYPDVKTVDKSTDTVLPDNTPAGDLPNNKPVSEFTIANLQTVFPFCIPFDLYKLYDTLRCDVVAPSFTWKFPYYKNNEIVYDEIEIDLKQFDTVAEILRTMELLAFLVFLTLKTRDLIRG